MEEQTLDFKGNKDVTQTCVLWTEKKGFFSFSFKLLQQ